MGAGASTLHDISTDSLYLSMHRQRWCGFVLLTPCFELFLGSVNFFSTGLFPINLSANTGLGGQVSELLHQETWAPSSPRLTLTPNQQGRIAMQQTRSRRRLCGEYQVVFAISPFLHSKFKMSTMLPMLLGFAFCYYCMVPTFISVFFLIKSWTKHGIRGRIGLARHILTMNNDNLTRLQSFFMITSGLIVAAIAH